MKTENNAFHRKSLFLFTFAVLASLAHVLAAPAKPITTKTILSVNDIQGDPAAYSGTVAINGVVAGLSKQDPKIFALIDTAEVKMCKAISCATFYLPVQFVGVRPQKGDEVNLTGSFIDKGRLFIATDLKILRRHEIGGQ